MVKENNTFEEIWNKLLEANKILIPLHPKPDGDSFGACIGMKHALEKQGKEVIVISKDDLSENLKDFPFSKEIEFGKEITDMPLEEFDVLLFLDHGTLQGHPEKIENKDFPDNLTTINMDHHETNSYYADLNYVKTESPSACSVIVELLQSQEIEFDAVISRALFLGICTDTYFFIHGNSLDSLKKAEFLIKEGGIKYKKEFFTPLNALPWSLKKLHGIILSNMDKKEIQGETIAYGFATKKDADENGLNLADIRLGIICMQDIKDVNLIFTLTELEDKIKGSFRSKGIDTTLFSKEFGGGGHQEASAFYLEKMSMEEAVEKVLSVIEEVGIHKI